jgi:threonine/homoserine/homoserine lactone efflux protein
MIPMRSVLAFAGVAAILVAIPGPSVLFTISRALTGGRRTALWNVVGATNPKTVAFFLIVLPQFTRPAAGHLTLQLLLLGCVFPVVALAIDAIWALAAGTLSQWLSRSPRRLAAIGGVGGLVMIGLGVSVAATGRRD